MDKSTKSLSKIYRAVHDGLCPNCGGDMSCFGRGSVGELHVCNMTAGCCGFTVTAEEMVAIRYSVAEWGREAVEEFNCWRAVRNVGNTDA